MSKRQDYSGEGLVALLVEGLVGLLGGGLAALLGDGLVALLGKVLVALWGEGLVALLGKVIAEDLAARMCEIVVWGSSLPFDMPVGPLLHHGDNRGSQNRTNCKGQACYRRRSSSPEIDA